MKKIEILKKCPDGQKKLVFEFCKLSKNYNAEHGLKCLAKIAETSLLPLFQIVTQSNNWVLMLKKQIEKIKPERFKNGYNVAIAVNDCIEGLKKLKEQIEKTNGGLIWEVLQM